MTNKEAITWLNNLITSIGEPQYSSLWHYEQALSEIKDMLGVLLSAQTEREKGEWIEQVDCEGKTRKILCNLCDWESGQYQWSNLNYCPNCGAKMK